MENFVEALDKASVAFKQLYSTFPGLSETKLKAGARKYKKKTKAVHLNILVSTYHFLL